MNTLKRLTLAICIVLLMNACAPLRTPVIVKNAPIEMFKYAYISPTKELTSSTGSTYGGQYGVYGSSTTTIQFISAAANELVSSCTAEGQGETEADDIRQAIRRALNGLFTE